MKLTSPQPKAEFPQITTFNFLDERMTRPCAADYLGVSPEFLESNIVVELHSELTHLAI